MAAAISRSRIRPAKDEWGVYDPQQAGLAALYARLDAKDPKAAATPSTAPAAPAAESNSDAPRTRPSLRDAK
jgi:hypothetical protein